jgi:hypothetical protein
LDYWYLSHHPSGLLDSLLHHLYNFIEISWTGRNDEKKNSDEFHAQNARSEHFNFIKFIGFEHRLITWSWIREWERERERDIPSLTGCLLNIYFFYPLWCCCLSYLFHSVSLQTTVLKVITDKLLISRFQNLTPLRYFLIQLYSLLHSTSLYSLSIYCFEDSYENE